jgi:16S rRNA (guanine966-N2)-methyltransferase
MRIISGKLKGKSVYFLKNSTTRPLKDSTKENIFNILKHSNLISTKIDKANILDLYSGIGSFGLECISRGAENVTFVEQEIEAFKILNKNLIKLSVRKLATLVNDKIENVLIKNEKRKYNIFFLDPPFADIEFIKNLALIKKNKIYQNNHIVIIHREKKSTDNFGNIMNILMTKVYGRSKIIFGTFN